MAYKFPIPLPWPTIVGPLGAAEDALSRLDERLRVSPIREGWIARTHFFDACASAWIDGELLLIEDLVLHDASMDIRSPTRELTRTHAVLRARRRILLEAPQWALSPSGLNALTGRAAVSEPEGQGAQRAQQEEVDAFERRRLRHTKTRTTVLSPATLPGSMRSANARTAFCPNWPRVCRKVAIRWS